MKIILFRHGEKQTINPGSAGDKSLVHLTDTGIRQVEELGTVLFQKFPQLINYPVIYSSIYARSIQSAQIIQSILGIKEVIQIPEFGEFIAYNNYQNSKDFREHLQLTAIENPNWVSPETHTSLNQTISTFENKLKEVCQKSSDGLVLISTHGGIIRHTIYSLDSKHRPSHDFIQAAKIHEAGYTILNFDGQNFSVDQFNVHDFLTS